MTENLPFPEQTFEDPIEPPYLKISKKVMLMKIPQISKAPTDDENTLPPLPSNKGPTPHAIIEDATTTST